MLLIGQTLVAESSHNFTPLNQPFALSLARCSALSHARHACLHTAQRHRVKCCPSAQDSRLRYWFKYNAKLSPKSCWMYARTHTLVSSVPYVSCNLLVWQRCFGILLSLSHTHRHKHTHTHTCVRAARTTTQRNMTLLPLLRTLLRLTLYKENIGRSAHQLGHFWRSEELYTTKGPIFITLHGLRRPSTDPDSHVPQNNIFVDLSSGLPHLSGHSPTVRSAFQALSLHFGHRSGSRTS